MRKKAAVVACALFLALSACAQEKVASSRGVRAGCRQAARLTKAEKKKAETTMAGLKGHASPSGGSPGAC